MIVNKYFLPILILIFLSCNSKNEVRVIYGCDNNEMYILFDGSKYHGFDFCVNNVQMSDKGIFECKENKSSYFIVKKVDSVDTLHVLQYFNKSQITNNLFIKIPSYDVRIINSIIIKSKVSNFESTCDTIKRFDFLALISENNLNEQEWLNLLAWESKRSSSNITIPDGSNTIFINSQNAIDTFKLESIGLPFFIRNFQNKMNRFQNKIE